MWMSGRWERLERWPHEGHWHLWEQPCAAKCDAVRCEANSSTVHCSAHAAHRPPPTAYSLSIAQRPHREPEAARLRNGCPKARPST